MKISGIPFVKGRNSSSDGDGKKYAIAIHNTSNDATAEQEASYATRRTDNVSSHFYVDNNSAVQSLDTAREAWHAGSTNGNNNAIAIEITGVNTWTRQQWLNNVAWDILGRIVGTLCMAYDGIPVRRPSVSEMKVNPKVRGIYSHDDMRRAWGGTEHTDPGPNFPWDKLMAVTNDYIKKVTPVATTDPNTDAKTHALFTATFYGGSSCGTQVPEQHRVADTSNGNAIVDKLNYIESMLETLLAR